METLLSSIDPGTLSLTGLIVYVFVKELFNWLSKKGVPDFNKVVENSKLVKDDVSVLKEKVFKHTEDICKIKEEALRARKDHEKMNPKIDEICETLNAAYDKIEEVKSESHEMRTWHDITDSDGVKIWYVRPSLEKSLEKLSDAISILTEVNRQMLFEFKTNSEELKRLEKKLKV